MPAKKMTCVVCDQQFEIGRWLGCQENPAQEHKVEPQEYYSASNNFQFHVRPESKVTGPSGQLINISGVTITFTGGKYITDSPEIQCRLDSIARELQTKEQYLDSRVGPQLREARQKAKIEEQRQLLDRQQAELEQLRAERAKGAAVAVEERPEDGEPKQEATKRAGRGRG